MLHLLDTSVCVSLIRGHSTLKSMLRTDECVISVITAAELEVGVRRSNRPTEQRLAVEGLLQLFGVLPLDLSAVRDYGDIRDALEKKGTPIGPLDTLIAAHARSLGATLITANVQEFKRVPGLKCLAWQRQ